MTLSTCLGEFNSVLVMHKELNVNVILYARIICVRKNLTDFKNIQTNFILDFFFLAEDNTNFCIPMSKFYKSCSHIMSKKSKFILQILIKMPLLDFIYDKMSKYFLTRRNQKLRKLRSNLKCTKNQFVKLGSLPIEVSI